MLCIGPTGTGKTLTISNKLLKNLPLEYISHFLTFSARTSANQTQDLIDSKLDKRQAPLFLPGSPCPPAWLSQLLSALPSQVGPGLPCRLLWSLLPSGIPAELFCGCSPLAGHSVVGCLEQPGVMSQDAQHGTGSRSKAILGRLKLAVASWRWSCHPATPDSLRTWCPWLLGSYSPSLQAEGCVWATPGAQLHLLH